MPELTEAECLLMDLRCRLAAAHDELARIRAVAAAAEGLREACEAVQRWRGVAPGRVVKWQGAVEAAWREVCERVPAAIAAYDAAKGGKS